MYCYICSKLRCTRSKYCFGFDTVYYKSTGHPASLLFSAQTFDLRETFPKLRVCIAYIPSSLCARLWLDITEYECFGCLQLIKWLYLLNPISLDVIHQLICHIFYKLLRNMYSWYLFWILYLISVIIR